MATGSVLLGGWIDQNSVKVENRLDRTVAPEEEGDGEEQGQGSTNAEARVVGRVLAEEAKEGQDGC